MARGRKPSVKSSVKEDVKTQEVPQNQDKVENENKELKEQLLEMQKQIATLTQAMSEQKEKQSNKESKEVVIKKDIVEEDEILDIPLNKVVKVMSLYTGGLNLKTSDNGKVFRFNNFGDIQPIIYNDLIQIMSHQHRFCQDGYFMILDKKVVKAHALDSLYTKLLDAKQVNNILEYEDEKIQEIYEGATDNLKDSIRDIVVKKINSKDNVDKNKVQVISDLCGYDLFAYARGDVETLVNNKR